MNQRLQAPPALFDGARMTRAEFHALYEAWPDETKFELIRGVVRMASPQRNPHSQDQMGLNTLLDVYRDATPGTDAGDNGTVILGDDSEPQPDVHLRVLPECGGQTRLNDEMYVVGAPELVTEVAHASRPIDLTAKLDMYRGAGTHEYLVLLVEERGLRWFDFRNGGELAPDGAGVWRSRAFPGLWVNGPALLARRTRLVLDTLQRGLASPEHAASVARLAAARVG